MSAVSDLRGSPTAPGGPCASTSAPRRASARRSPCSTRAAGAHERGADVVVGFVETHGRARTAEQIGDLEVMPRRRFEHRGSDVRGDGRRRHPAPPSRAGARRRARPHQRARARATRSAGRTSTSCSPPASTSSRPSTSSTSSRSTTSSSGSPASASARRCPTASCGAADQIELVDMAPEALRRRLAHGNVYAADKIDAALGNYFRAGNLSALRELALLWVADRVDDALAGLPRAPRHHRPVGDARAGRRRPRPARPAPTTSCGGRRGSPSGPRAT